MDFGGFISFCDVKGFLIITKECIESIVKKVLILDLNDPRRHRSAANRKPTLGNASSLHECWSMDFVSDQLYDGARFRALTIDEKLSQTTVCA